MKKDQNKRLLMERAIRFVLKDIPGDELRDPDEQQKIINSLNIMEFQELRRRFPPGIPNFPEDEWKQEIPSIVQELAKESIGL